MLWYYLSAEHEKQRQKRAYSWRALTVTQILGVQQNKYTLKNLVAIGNPEVNGYMLSNINTINFSSLTSLDLTCTYQ